MMVVVVVQSQFIWSQPLSRLLFESIIVSGWHFNRVLVSRIVVFFTLSYLVAFFFSFQYLLRSSSFHPSSQPFFFCFCLLSLFLLLYWFGISCLVNLL